MNSRAYDVVGGDLKIHKAINRKITDAATRGGARAVLEIVSDKLPQMNGMNMATSLHRIARHNMDGEEARTLVQHPTFEALVESIEREAFASLTLLSQRVVVAPCHIFPAQCASIVAWSLASLNVCIPRMLDVLLQLAAPRLHEFQAYEVTNILWAYAKLQWPCPLTTRAIAENIRMRQKGQFKAQCLSVAVWSLSMLDYFDPDLFMSIADELCVQVKLLKAEGVNNTLWAFRKQNLFHRQLFEALEKSAGGHSNLKHEQPTKITASYVVPPPGRQQLQKKESSPMSLEACDISGYVALPYELLNVRSSSGDISTAASGSDDGNGQCDESIIFCTSGASRVLPATTCLKEKTIDGLIVSQVHVAPGSLMEKVGMAGRPPTPLHLSHGMLDLPVALRASAIAPTTGVSPWQVSPHVLQPVAVISNPNPQQTQFATQNSYFLAYPFCCHGNLTEYALAHQVTSQRAARILRQVLEGVEQIISSNEVSLAEAVGTIAPSSIFVDSMELVKVRVPIRTGRSMSLQKTLEAMQFMSPEEAEGKHLDSSNAWQAICYRIGLLLCGLGRKVPFSMTNIKAHDLGSMHRPDLQDFELTGLIRSMVQECLRIGTSSPPSRSVLMAVLDVLAAGVHQEPSLSATNGNFWG